MSPRRGGSGDRRREGLRARSRRGRIGRTWWSERWTQVFEGIGLDDRLQRGRTLARSGSVHSLEILPGEVRAEVAGSRGEMHPVRLRLRVFPAENWLKIQSALAGRALFAARLLAGEMPPSIEEAFEEAGVPLFPAEPGDLEAACDCADEAAPCAHAAAVLYLVAERLDEDPFQIFLLRGRTRREILVALRHRQAREVGSRPGTPAAEAGAGAEGAPDTPAPVPDPGEEDARAILEAFADPAADLQPLDPRIMPPPIQEAVLRRLGPPPGTGPDGLAMEALRRAYEVIGRWALRVAAREGENGKG